MSNQSSWHIAAVNRPLDETIDEYYVVVVNDSTGVRYDPVFVDAKRAARIAAHLSKGKIEDTVNLSFKVPAWVDSAIGLRDYVSNNIVPMGDPSKVGASMFELLLMSMVGCVGLLGAFMLSLNAGIEMPAVVTLVVVLAGPVAIVLMVWSVVAHRLWPVVVAIVVTGTLVIVVSVYSRVIPAVLDALHLR